MMNIEALNNNNKRHIYLTRQFGHFFKAIFPIGLFILGLLYQQTAVGQQVTTGKVGEPGTWLIIGTTQAQFTVNHDGIIVQPPHDIFRKLQIKVTGAPLRLIKLQVIYEEGEPDILPVRVLIPEGGVSRTFKLSGSGTRHLRRIDFWYDTGGVRTGLANVTVLGMK